MIIASYQQRQKEKLKLKKMKEIILFAFLVIIFLLAFGLAGWGDYQTCLNYNVC